MTNPVQFNSSIAVSRPYASAGDADVSGSAAPTDSQQTHLQQMQEAQGANGKEESSGSWWKWILGGLAIAGLGFAVNKYRKGGNAVENKKTETPKAEEKKGEKTTETAQVGDQDNKEKAQPENKMKPSVTQEEAEKYAQKIMNEHIDPEVDKRFKTVQLVSRTYENNLAIKEKYDQIQLLKGKKEALTEEESNKLKDYEGQLRELLSTVHQREVDTLGADFLTLVDNQSDKWTSELTKFMKNEGCSDQELSLLESQMGTQKISLGLMFKVLVLEDPSKLPFDKLMKHTEGYLKALQDPVKSFGEVCGLSHAEGEYSEGKNTYK